MVKHDKYITLSATYSLDPFHATNESAFYRQIKVQEKEADRKDNIRQGIVKLIVDSGRYWRCDSSKLIVDSEGTRYDSSKLIVDSGGERRVRLFKVNRR